MSFDKLQTDGQGRILLRLEVEGWPQMWSSATAVTAASILDGRAIYPGLSHRGLQIRDRVQMREATIEATGMTFRLAPTQGGTAGAADPLLRSLSLVPEPVAELGDDLHEDATVVDVTGFAALSNDTVYHLGTEAIRVGTWPNVTRRIWRTQRQAFNLAQFDREHSVKIYAHPPTMEGRRCYLFVYGDEDDLAGDGTCVWRGMIARAPRLDSDGATWLLEALPITHVLRQSVAASATETVPLGIYHHDACAVRLIAWTKSGTDPSVRHGPYFYSGFDESAAALQDSINTFLADCVTDIAVANLGSIELEYTADGPRLAVTALGDLAIRLTFGSLLLGEIETFGVGFINAGGDVRLGLLTDLLSAGEWYTEACNAQRTASDQIFSAAPAYVVGDFRNSQSINPNPDPARPWPPWRLYVQHSLEQAVGVRITGFVGPEANAEAGTFLIEQSGVDTDMPDGVDRHFIDLQPTPGSTAFGPLHSATESTITPTRSYGEMSTAADFVQELKNEAVFANEGDTPWITDADLTDWDTLDRGTILRRVYLFVRELPLEDILKEELKLAGWFMRIEADGRIGVVRAEPPAEAVPVEGTHDLTEATICTPERQVMPDYEPQRDGVESTVTIQHVYDPIADEWKDEPTVYDNPDVIATHKRRGVSRSEIKPYSAPSTLARVFTSGRGAAVNEALRDTAKRRLALFGRDYVVVTIGVPWRHFAILCGDHALLTHSLLPNGDGTRGMVQRAAICVGRTWNLDPGRGGNSQGMLELWIPAQPVYGYAPSGVITGQTQVPESFEWDIELDPAHEDNIRWSATGDGLVLRRFTNGDFVRVFEIDSETPTVAIGIISSIDAQAGTAHLTLESAWSGVASRLEFQLDLDGAHATESQRRSVYVADEGGLLPSGDPGRRAA